MDKINARKWAAELTQMLRNANNAAGAGPMVRVPINLSRATVDRMIEALGILTEEVS